MLLTPLDHKLRADHYLDILKILNGSDQNTSDWQIIVAFYCALQVVEYDLSHYSNLTCANHFERSQLIMPTAKGYDQEVPGNVYFAYNELETFSKVARYMEGKPKGGMKAPGFQFFGARKLKLAFQHLDVVLWHYQQKRTCTFPEIYLSLRTEVNSNEFQVLKITEAIPLLQVRERKSRH